MGSIFSAGSAIGGVASLGLSALNSNTRTGTASAGLASGVHNAMLQTLPATPTAPEQSAADPGATTNALMEAERERERRAALARSQRAPEVLTSGLGASGLATTAKKSLLGG